MLRSLQPAVKPPKLHLAISKDGGVIFDPERDRLLKLNSIAVEMWMLLVSGESESQVARHMAARYAVDPGRVLEDLHQLVASAAELGLTPRGVLLAEHAGLPAVHNTQAAFPWYAQDPAVPRPHPSAPSVLFAVVGLALFDFILSFFSMDSLCAFVKAWPVKNQAVKDQPDVIGRLCAAVERACVWYPKKTLCLQRSAVTTCLLRSRGIFARMVLGVRPMPFVAHAWVEAEGSVVNDFPRVQKFYSSVSSY